MTANEGPPRGHERDLLDRQQIYDVLMRYCRGCDRLDVALLASAFHPDAVDEHNHFSSSGAEVAENIIGRTRTFFKWKRTMHSIQNHLVRLDGDRAYGETHWTLAAVSIAENPEVLEERGGRYLDRFDRRGGEWRIAHHYVITEWIRKTELAESFADLGIEIRGTQTDADPSYRFLLEL